MKKFVIGVIVGAFLATAGTAAASTIIDKVTASVRTDYSVEVDGEKVKLENAPLAYKGSAYIAVREISNVIGKEVGFENGVIQINTPVEEMTTETYKAKLKMLEENKSSIVRRIEFVKEAIRSADSGEFKPTEEDYADFKESLANFEAELITVDQEIADLKASYPQYSESAE